jgi:peptidyl-prolyl cis-trans isomerase B (cyclophilin B)
VTSNRDRQRAAARARLEREMAERAQQHAKSRRTRTAVLAGAGALVVILAVVFIIVAVGGGKKKTPVAAASASGSPTPTSCHWLPLIDPSASPKPTALPPQVKDVGTPPASGEKRTGTELMTITTNLGDIKVEMDAAHAPCATASFAYLAGKKFFDNSKCHRLVTSGIFVLQCGDPSATGEGGPAYRYAEENLPTGDRPAYPQGTVAIAKTSDPSTSGSQFFIVYKDTDLDANYTVLGHVTTGLDIVQKVADAGVIPDPSAQSAGDGAPKQELDIKSMTVTP